MMRTLGKTGLQVSEVGFGAWQLGNHEAWGSMSDAEACALVRRALEMGCNLFDTAPGYGDTNSERLLGQALAGRRQEVVLVSKFGHAPGSGEDFSPEGMWESLQASLKRLRTDYLDVLLLHNPPAEFQQGSHPVWEALRQARAQGKIRYYGASLDFAEELRTVLASSDAQVLEILFNILHQDARRAFTAVRKHNVGILTKVPLDSGWLTGKYRPDSRFTGVRDRWTEAQIRQRAELVDRLSWLTRDGVPLAQKAIGYLLAYPEVSCVIPGVRSLAQLELNQGATGHALTPDERTKLELFWDDFTGHGKNPLPW